jgi:hypothetical protein
MKTPVKTIQSALQEGRYQRSLALIAGMSGLLSGLEVTSEHYKGSFGQKVMYSPVMLSATLAGAGIAASIDPKYARRILPTASWLLILDGVTGFGFHIRGISRKPGGWKNTVFNIVMGPPIFAPLLLGLGGFLGLTSVELLPEESARALSPEKREELKKGLAGATAVSALLNGSEAFYSHYKSGFSSRSQWIPVVLTPPLVFAGIHSIKNDRTARTVLPLLSGLAIAAGSIGFGFHVRASLRRPRGLKLYNMIYGPPPLAPLLFAATGLLGILASQLASPQKDMAA